MQAAQRGVSLEAERHLAPNVLVYWLAITHLFGNSPLPQKLEIRMQLQ